MFTAPPPLNASHADGAGVVNSTVPSGGGSDLRLPGNHADMHAAGVPHGGFPPDAQAQSILNSVATQGAWTTGNVQMDDWLRSRIDDNSLLLRFARVHIVERMDIVAQLMKRSSSITNLTSYFAGCINKSLTKTQGKPRVGPYSPSGGANDAFAVRPLPSPVRTEVGAPACVSPGLSSAPMSPGASSVGGHSVAAAVPHRRESLASSASSLARSTSSSAASTGSTQLSAWAMQALKEANNKSKFLSRVCRQLDTATCVELQRLTPEWMYNISMAVALGCRNGVHANLAARECLQSHADCGSPGLVAKPQCAPSKPVMHLVMLHLGSWQSFSQLAMQAAIRFAASEVHDMTLEVNEVHIFPSSCIAAKVEQAVVAAMQWRTQVWTSAVELVPLVFERCASWASQSAKVLLLARQDRPSDQRSFQELEPGPAPLHGRSMHLLWRHLAAARCLASHLGNDSIAQFFLSSSTLQQSSSEPVTNWVGTARCLDPLKYKAPLAMHMLYSSPTYPEPMCRCAAWDSSQEVNGWRWAPGSQDLATVLQGYRIHSRIHSLQQVVIFRERDLLPDEVKALQMARAVHSSSGNNGFLPVGLHAAMLGCKDLPVAEAMNQVSPCNEYLHPATGMAMAANESNAEVCGKSRWCSSCEEVHEALFELPHLSQLSDHVAAWLGVCLQVWAGKATGTFAQADSCPEHECNDACSEAGS